MTVIELIAELQELPPNSQIILQKDSEGNDYSPLMGAALGIYVPDNSYSGLVHDPEGSAEDVCIDENEWEKMKKDPDKACVVLYPIN